MELRLDVATSDAPGAVRTALGTLPRSYGPASSSGSAPPAVAVIRGAPGWTEDAARAARAGARGILVVDPVADRAAPDDLAALARIPIVLDTPWRHRSALDAARAPLHRLLRPHALIECRVVGRPGDASDRQLLGVLGLLRGLGVPARRLHLHEADAHGFAATGELDQGVRACVWGILTPSADPGASIRLIDAAGSVEIDLPAPDGGAQPARVVVDDESDSATTIGPFETSTRGALIRLHRLVGGTGRAGPADEGADDVASFLADAELVGAATSCAR
ncbi:hypothetical protein ACDF64_00295 [Agromyces sp. MMS24-JH15]|uniref:hypothetical protein n=1 Tax=Agromyces sp. MMS24-JH15 TaxID=3243765 RepID=UPI0037478452